MRDRRKMLLAVGALALLLAGATAGVRAHDIPSDVTVRAFVKPEGDRLRMLVRVPLEAMLDINFPLRGPGYLDIEGAEQLLPDAAMLWLGQEIELYEDGVRLPEPTLAAVRLSLPSNRAFNTYEDALAPRHPPGTGCPRPRRSSGGRRCWTCCSTTTRRPPSPPSRSGPASSAWACG